MTMPEVFPQILEVFEAPLEREEPEAEPQVQVMAEPCARERVQPQVVRKTAPAVTVEQTPVDSEKKEKIDPKKLIVYSEIMNRKY